MKIIIIGGTRFIGYNVVFFLKYFFDITVISRRLVNIPGVNFFHSDKFDIDISNLSFYDIAIDFTLFNSDDIKFAELLSLRVSHYFAVSTSWIEYLYLENLRNLLGISYDYLVAKNHVENSLLAYSDKFIIFRLPPIVGGDASRRLDWNSDILSTLLASSCYDNFVDLLHPLQVCQIFLAAINQVDQISNPIQDVGSSSLFTLGQWLEDIYAFENNTNYRGMSVLSDPRAHVLNQSAHSKRNVINNFSDCSITPNLFLRSLS
ncbi:hypothetical protein OAA55_00465 [bacterium]|nr:hypothetical protein [bacterium]